MKMNGPSINFATIVPFTTMMMSASLAYIVQGVGSKKALRCQKFDSRRNAAAWILYQVGKNKSTNKKK
jgi:hypothetical protein